MHENAGRALQDANPQLALCVGEGGMGVNLYTFGWALSPPTPILRLAPQLFTWHPNLATLQNLFKQVPTLTQRTPVLLPKMKNLYF